MLGELTLHIVSEGWDPLVELAIIIVFLKWSFAVLSCLYCSLLVFTSVNHGWCLSCWGWCWCLCHPRVLLLSLGLSRLLLLLQTLPVHLLENTHWRLALTHHITHFSHRSTLFLLFIFGGIFFFLLSSTSLLYLLLFILFSIFLLLICSKHIEFLVKSTKGNRVFSINLNITMP